MQNYKYLIPALFVLSGCASSIEASKELQTKEALLISSNNKDQLVQFYKQNLNSDDSYRLKLVKVYLDIKDVKSAELYTNTFTEEDLDNTEYSYTMARLNYLKQNYTQAASFIERYKDESGEDARYFHLRGKIYAEQHEFTRAIDFFNKSRQAGMLDSDVMNDVAVVHMMQKDYVKALEILYRLYLKNPSDSKLRSNLIFTSIKANRNDIALNALKDLYPEDEARVKLLALTKKLRDGNEKKDQPVNKTHKKRTTNISKANPEKHIGKGMEKTVTHNRDMFSSNFLGVPKHRKFRVQVLATYKTITPEYLEYLKSNYGDVYSYTHELWNRYCIGEFESLETAKQFLSTLNIKGSFIVDYTNKKHIKL